MVTLSIVNPAKIWLRVSFSWPKFSATCSQNQFFISGLSGDEIIRNRVLEALYRRIMRAYNDKKCFRVIIVIPLLPGFQVLICCQYPSNLKVDLAVIFLYWILFQQGGVDDGGAASVRAIMHWQYRTICRGHNSILHNLYDLLGPKTHDYISFYGLRAYGKLFDGGPVASSQVLSCTSSFINAPYHFC
jgi:phospholipase D1/2